MAINISSRDLKNLKQITDGGEANIYRYDTNTFLKEFYNPDVDMCLKELKIKKLMKIQKHRNIKLPLEIVTVNNKFAAYLLEEFKNSEPVGELAKKKHIRINGYTNKDILEVLLEVYETFMYIHKQGMIVGDISEQNVLISGKKIAYIDTDSYGIENLPAVTFTEIYTDPKAYGINDTINLTKETDMYSFAVLVFKILTQMHPFEGKYEKDENMNTIKRMKNRISVLGKEKIVVPPMIPSWKWISPKLEKIFLDIFENGKRGYIYDELKDLYDNLKLCKKHNGYYYGKYNVCPVCDANAKVNMKPTVVKSQAPSTTLALSVLFESNDIDFFFDFGKYFSTDKEIVSVKNNTRIRYTHGCKVEFLENGMSVEIYPDYYNIKSRDKVMSRIERFHNSNYSISGNYIYYISEEKCLCRLEATRKGNGFINISDVATKTFISSCDDKYIAILQYQDSTVILKNNCHIKLEKLGKIMNYALKYDKASENWLFIYQTSTGSFRTLVIGEKKVEFDSNIYNYSASPLSNIAFSNNTIYAPSDSKIVGINWRENKVKYFDIGIVTEESKIEFYGKGFNIISENKLYKYGK